MQFAQIKALVDMPQKANPSVPVQEKAALVDALNKFYFVSAATKGIFEFSTIDYAASAKQHQHAQNAKNKTNMQLR